PPRRPSAHHTPSLHDALPICSWAILGHAIESFEVVRPAATRISPPIGLVYIVTRERSRRPVVTFGTRSRVYKKAVEQTKAQRKRDRKSTRLNSSHEWISYAVF